jgi:hypothetical protein
MNHRLADELAWFAKSKGSAMRNSIDSRHLATVIPAEPGWSVQRVVDDNKWIEKVIAWKITQENDAIDVHPVTAFGAVAPFSLLFFNGEPQE